MRTNPQTGRLYVTSFGSNSNSLAVLEHHDLDSPPRYSLRWGRWVAWRRTLRLAAGTTWSISPTTMRRP